MTSRLPEPSPAPEHPAPAQQVAAAVRRRRLELGWTQEQLAERSGISAATVRKIEAGAQSQYRALTCTRLCSALGWAPDALDSVSTPPRPDAAGRRLSAPDADDAPTARSATNGSQPPAPPPPAREAELAALSGRIAALDGPRWERLVAFVDGLTALDR